MRRTQALYWFVLLCCISAHSASAENPADKLETIPPEAFFESVKDSDFTFSPDGNHLAYITRDGGSYYLSITDLKKIEIIAMHLLSAYPVHSIYWLNNNRLLYESVGLIRVINIDGTEHKTLISYTYAADKIKNILDFYKNFRTWKVVGLIEGGEEILASSMDQEGYMHIHRINVYTGEKTDIINGEKFEIHEWFTDMSGQIRIGARYREGGSELFSLSFKKEKPKLTPLVLDKGKYTFGLQEKSFLEQRATIAGFAPNGNFLYLCENINSDTFGLVGFDLVQDKIVMTIAADHKYDVCGPGISMQPLFYQRTLAGIRYDRDKSHTLLLDDTFKSIQNVIDKKYNNKVNTILTWTSNLDKILFHSYNEHDNGRIYIYYPKERRMALQSYASLQLEKFKTGNSTKAIEYKARGNHAIEAYLTTPPNPKNAPLPLIVMPHASPAARDTFGYNSHAQFFASRGYAVLQPNYPGSIGYGRKHLQSGFEELSNLVIDDIADGARNLIASGVADKNRVFIFGYSYGGYAAIMSTIRHPDLYRAAVSASAPLDVVAELSRDKKPTQYFPYDFWRKPEGNPKKEKIFIREISPLHRAKDIKVPLLIAHGDEDPVIPVKQVRDFEKVKDTAPVEIKTMIFKNEGHGFSTTNNVIYFLEKSIEHFQNAKSKDNAGQSGG